MPVLSLEVYVPSDRAGSRALLATCEGVDHVVVGGACVDGSRVLVTAELIPRIVDALLPELVACGVPGDEIAVIHRDGLRPMGLAGGRAARLGRGDAGLVELAMASRQYARTVPLYLAFMACAGVIADFGVLTRSPILVVGAMALSPDLLPLCATCVGLVGRRPRLAGRAFTALVAGLATAGLAAFVVTALLRVGGYPPAKGSLGDGGLGALPTVNVATLASPRLPGSPGSCLSNPVERRRRCGDLDHHDPGGGIHRRRARGRRRGRAPRFAGRAGGERGPDPGHGNGDPRPAATRQAP